MQIVSKEATDCESIHDFQIVYCFSLAIYVVIILFSIGYNITIFDHSSLSDALVFIKFGMRVKMIILLTLLAVKSGLHLRYLSNCPWTPDDKQNYALEQVLHFVSSISDTMYLYLTFCLAIGYSVSKIELSMFELKLLFWLPCTKFFLSQILITLASFHFNINLLFAIMISFDASTVITVGSFML